MIFKKIFLFSFLLKLLRWFCKYFEKGIHSHIIVSLSDKLGTESVVLTQHRKMKVSENSQLVLDLSCWRNASMQRRISSWIEIVRTRTDMSNAMPNQGRIFSDEFWNEHIPKEWARGILFARTKWHFIIPMHE